MGEWFDPRLTVFVIWGFFVMLFVCVPSKRLVARLFQMIGFPCCDRMLEAEEERDRERDRRRDGTEYENLSPARKHEIDSNRSIALLRHLSRFSLTLKKEHMVQRTADVPHPNNDNEMKVEEGCDKTHSTTGDLGHELKDPQCKMSSNEDGPEQNCIENDLEKGESRRGIDPPAREEEEKIEESNLKYSHISIPLPGRGEDDRDAFELETECSTTNEVPKRKSGFRIFFGGRSKVKEGVKETETKEKQFKESIKKNVEVRDVPIFCAVCLTEYEISERVCWSSNPECTHVFHEDCILQWLISLGKTKSKMQRFSTDPTEEELLQYQLECPCCRQDFILKSASPQSCGDDAV